MLLEKVFDWSYALLLFRVSFLRAEKSYSWNIILLYSNILHTTAAIDKFPSPLHSFSLPLFLSAIAQYIIQTWGKQIWVNKQNRPGIPNHNNNNKNRSSSNKNDNSKNFGHNFNLKFCCAVTAKLWHSVRDTIYMGTTIILKMFFWFYAWLSFSGEKKCHLSSTRSSKESRVAIMATAAATV